MEQPIPLILGNANDEHGFLVDVIRSREDIHELRTLREDPELDSITYLEDAIEEGDDLYLVRTGLGEVVAMLTLRVEKKRAHLLSLFIHKDWEGLGLGYALTAYAITFAPLTVLYVADKNERAIGVYEAIGFTKNHLCPMYDAEGDAWLMTYKESSSKSK
ncbi:hypothetical protein GR7B_00112 [Vibrio phage vB_VcorM_GR7B]|nr:hypothetical protein GR7B_00112 [Vibrio phage vB_VcorM_GR7B]